MPSSEDIAHQQKLLDINRRNLAHYLGQQAALGSAYAPPGVANGIREARNEVRRIKRILRDWNVCVEYHPDDVAASVDITSLNQGAPTPPSPSRIPYPRNQSFVGRDAELRQLEAWLVQPGAAVVTGLGGVGKTQLVTEYAHRCDADRAGWPGGVHWLSMSVPNAIETSVADLGRLLDIPDDLPLPEQVKRVKRAWAAPTQRLLVFDNCEDPALLKAWRPTSGGARVLVTARRTDWPRATARRLELPHLPRPAALELLCRPRADELDMPLERLTADPNAAAICAHLGDLALVVHLAGAYLAQKPHLPLHAFLAELEAQPLGHAALTALDSDTPTEHLAHVAQTFVLSFALLDDRRQTTDDGPTINDESSVNRLARRILDVAAHCTPGEPIPLDLLRRAVMDDGQPTTDDGPTNGEDTAPRNEESVAGRQSSVVSFSDAMHRLVTVGLARYADEGRALTVHRLVAAYARQRQTAADSVADALAKTLSGMTYDVNEAGLPAAMLPLLRHARHVADAAEQRGSEHAATLLNNLGSYFDTVADYSTARALYERALRIFEAHFGPDHPKVAIDVNNLGMVAHDQGDLQAARALYARALHIFEDRFGPEHPDTQTVRNNLAAVLAQMDADANGETNDA